MQLKHSAMPNEHIAAGFPPSGKPKGAPRQAIHDAETSQRKSSEYQIRVAADE
jgi:hypothetical protein